MKGTTLQMQCLEGKVSDCSRSTITRLKWILGELKMAHLKQILIA
jgi:hypothetical protein